ncbi:hypothetical protein NMY22_g17954 [Coprinellus aureogranulatus]|nr:hypothetical protein NMY22_g17954 [Coprinellus aureogranulatus]
MRVAAERVSNALRSRTTDSARRQVIRAYPQVLRAGIKFLTRNQPGAAHDSMVRHLCDYRCVCTAEESAKSVNLHEYTTREEDVRMPQLLHPNHHLMQVVRTIVDCTTSLLSATTTGKFSNEQGSGDNQPWPASADGLLPYGYADSVDGLDLWASEPNGHIVYSVASCLAMFHAPFDRATFKPPSCTFALSMPLKHLDTAMELRTPMLPT